MRWWLYVNYLDFDNNSTHIYSCICMSNPDGSVVKNTPANAEDMGLIPGSERAPGEGNSNRFRYSCLGNPMDRGDWWATVHGVRKDTDMTCNWTTTSKSLHHTFSIYAISFINLLNKVEPLGWSFQFNSSCDLVSSVSFLLTPLSLLFNFIFMLFFFNSQDFKFSFSLRSVILFSHREH